MYHASGAISLFINHLLHTTTVYIPNHILVSAPTVDNETCQGGHYDMIWYTQCSAQKLFNKWYYTIQIQSLGVQASWRLHECSG